jgi:hypothetical protein
MGKMRNSYIFLDGKPEGRDHLRDLAVEGRIVLQWILNK